MISKDIPTPPCVIWVLIPAHLWEASMSPIGVFLGDQLPKRPQCDIRRILDFAGNLFPPWLGLQLEGGGVDQLLISQLFIQLSLWYFTIVAIWN